MDQWDREFMAFSGEQRLVVGRMSCLRRKIFNEKNSAWMKNKN